MPANLTPEYHPAGNSGGDGHVSAGTIRSLTAT